MRTTNLGAAIVTLMRAALTMAGCGTGDGSSTSPSSQPVLSETTGDSPFYLESVSVRVAESFPVQLFLDVSGNAPTPCHSVAYAVQKNADRIAVTITSAGLPLAANQRWGRLGSKCIESPRSIA